MRALKGLFSKSKISDDASSSNSDTKSSTKSSTKSDPKSQDTQKSSGSPTQKQDSKRKDKGKSPALEQEDSVQSRRRPSISEDRGSSSPSYKKSAIREEFENPPYGAWPAPGVSYRKTGSGHSAPNRRRSLREATHGQVSKVASLSTINSEDSAAIAISTAEHEKYAFLKSLETIFVVDDSATMTNRWNEICSALQILVPICAKYQKGGIEVGFLNQKGRFKGAKHPEDVARMFEDTPTKGEIPTGEMVCMIVRKYMQRFMAWSQKWGDDFFVPLNIIVITSGVPTDIGSYFKLTDVIERNAQKLQDMCASEAQLGIHFFQVGYDMAAADFLDELNDDSKNSFARDIIDVYTCRGYDGILSPEAVFGAVEARLTRTRKGKGKA